MSDLSSPPILPAHIEETVRAIARVQAEHQAGASSLQRLVERLTSRAGRPEFVGALTILVVGWMALNLALMEAGLRVWDEPPFYWLQGAVGLAALYMTILILTTQRREDELANARAQLTLELSILSEQKSAKIIALLEEMRRDAPTLPNRHDAEAVAMAVPADPQAVLEAIKDTHEELMLEVSEAAPGGSAEDEHGGKHP